MINNLKNCQKSTLIGQLPDIINSNNQAVTNEFNWIFDSSLNRLTKSVYAPTGSVKSHFGEFTNLSCEYITIKNIESLKNSMQSSIDSDIQESFRELKNYIDYVINSSNASAFINSSNWVLEHNFLVNRFKDESLEELSNNGYMHDASAILYEYNSDNLEFISVAKKLNNLDLDIDKIYSYINTISIDTSSLLIIIDDVSIINSSISNINSTVFSINQAIKNIDSSIAKIEKKINNNYMIYDDNVIKSEPNDFIEYDKQSQRLYIKIYPNIYTVIGGKDNDFFEVVKSIIDEPDKGLGEIIFQLYNDDDKNLQEFKFRIDCPDPLWELGITFNIMYAKNNEQCPDEYGFINNDCVPANISYVLVEDDIWNIHGLESLLPKYIYEFDIIDGFASSKRFQRPNI